MDVLPSTVLLLAVVAGGALLAGLASALLAWLLLRLFRFKATFGSTLIAMLAAVIVTAAARYAGLIAAAREVIPGEAFLALYVSASVAASWAGLVYLARDGGGGRPGLVRSAVVAFVIALVGLIFTFLRFVGTAMSPDQPLG